jgi:hypothetical protein
VNTTCACFECETALHLFENSIGIFRLELLSLVHDFAVS